ncbi:MAG: glycosyltransferase [Umezawaea sp.]
MPSPRETFGLVAFESMSFGIPVVAFDVGNLSALVSAGDGAATAVRTRSES